MPSTRIIGIAKIDNEQARRRQLILLWVLAFPISLAVVLPVIVHAVREYIVPQFYIICLFLTVTGLPCPFCGLTQSLFSLSQGELLKAFWYHPLGPIVWGGIALFMSSSFVLLIFRRRVELRIPRDRKGVSVVAGVLLVWIVNILLGHH
jgi:type II secretory pathway component PulF